VALGIEAGHLEIHPHEVAVVLGMRHVRNLHPKVCSLVGCSIEELRKPTKRPVGYDTIGSYPGGKYGSIRSSSGH
jgi:hypothetical protein